MRYCTFIFSISCSIASVTSYFIEKEVKNLQNGDVHIAQIPDYEMEYLENHLAHWGRWWLVVLHFSRSFMWALVFFDRRFPLTVYWHIYFHLVEFKFVARRLENYIAYSVCSCAKSQEIFDWPFAGFGTWADPADEQGNG